MGHESYLCPFHISAALSVAVTGDLTDFAAYLTAILFFCQYFGQVIDFKKKF